MPTNSDGSDIRGALSHLSDKSPIMVAILDAGESANDVDILNTTDVFQVTYNTYNLSLIHI